MKLVLKKHLKNLRKIALAVSLFLTHFSPVSHFDTLKTFPEGAGV